MPGTPQVLPSLEPFPNFTPRAQQVLALARKEADRLNHNFVGTEHLLLGMIGLGQGTAVNVLGRMGLDIEKTRLEILKELDPNYHPAADGQKPRLQLRTPDFAPAAG